MSLASTDLYQYWCRVLNQTPCHAVGIVPSFFLAAEVIIKDGVGLDFRVPNLDRYPRAFIRGAED